ncbi:MAG: 2-phospho-L-lactate transferase [Candidatus Brockarchaeota archaeon]|nr:2-phospho-L-lactate transferase [Candidatus Brockarchaeota archaeon]
MHAMDDVVESTMKKVVVLSAGTGGRKLVAGFARVVEPRHLTIIANTGDDFEHLGLHVSPDVDSIIYQLSGLLDEARGWGRRGDTFTFLGEVGRLGGETWFQLGDKDLAVHVVRTALLKKGLSLTEVTARVASNLGVRSFVLPMSDDGVQTKVVTDKGVLSFNEYLVREKGLPSVRSTFYDGSKKARPGPEVLKSIYDADLVVIGPSNPVAGIGPILSIKSIKKALESCREKVSVVSPLIGDKAVSGPSVRMMQVEGLEGSVLGVARFYCSVASKIYLHTSDAGRVGAIEGLRMRATATDILMKGQEDSARLALEILEGEKTAF